MDATWIAQVSRGPARLSDNSFLTDPYPMFAALRQHAPVYWDESTNSWYVTRHGMVSDLLVDPRLSSPCVDAELAASLQKSDHVKRVIRWFFGKSKEPPWQGLKWVLDLLPFRPRLALDVIQAYVVAHAPLLSDAMYDALHDAQAIIRARYIGVPKSTDERVWLLQELSFREFEQVVEQLYSQMGYATQLTPSSKDDGRDIIATSSVAGRRERVLIECKRYQGKVRIETIRALQGIVGAELANKGALVTTAQFTRGARKLEAGDRRIELISGPQLVSLLNEHLGHTWPVNIELLARERPIAVRLRENGQN